jgi:hypothetical protein
MKIEDVTAGRNAQEKVDLDGLQVPVAALKNLLNEGYIHIKTYRENRTFSLWGKNCTACLSMEQIQEKAG